MESDNKIFIKFDIKFGNEVPVDIIALCKVQETKS